MYSVQITYKLSGFPYMETIAHLVCYDVRITVIEHLLSLVSYSCKYQIE
jgi:hypothetical protein